MSARKREQKRGARPISDLERRDEQSIDRALYVYCIGEAHELSALLGGRLPAAIEDEGPLELIEEKNLAVIASLVPIEGYNEEALQVNLKDAAWMALRAMRHEKVVDFFATRASIVPLRFGTIYLERKSVEKMLMERNAELRATLERLRGRVEWGVNVFCDRKILLEGILNLSPRLRELNEQALAATPGQAYLVRKKIEAMRTDEARAEIKSTVERIERELQSQSEAAVRLRILRDEAGEHGELVGKLAFLVERSRFDEFRSAAKRLAAETMDAGFKLELTGPWPAYNFVISNQTGQEQ